MPPPAVIPAKARTHTAVTFNPMRSMAFARLMTQTKTASKPLTQPL